MYQLQEKDSKFWKELVGGNFTVKNSQVPFTGNTLDQSQEYENKRNLGDYSVTSHLAEILSL